MVLDIEEPVHRVVQRQEQNKEQQQNRYGH